MIYVIFVEFLCCSFLPWYWYFCDIYLFSSIPLQVSSAQISSAVYMGRQHFTPIQCVNDGIKKLSEVMNHMKQLLKMVHLYLIGSMSTPAGELWHCSYMQWFRERHNETGKIYLNSLLWSCFLSYFDKSCFNKVIYQKLSLSQCVMWVHVGPLQCDWWRSQLIFTVTDTMCKTLFYPKILWIMMDCPLKSWPVLRFMVAPQTYWKRSGSHTHTHTHSGINNFALALCTLWPVCRCF